MKTLDINKICGIPVFKKVYCFVGIKPFPFPEGKIHFLEKRCYGKTTFFIFDSNYYTLL